MNISSAEFAPDFTPVWGCIISIIIAVVVYATCILVSKTIVKDDILMLPKGEKIAEILEKYKLLG